MAPRCKTYRENELFHAAPYIKALKGDRDDTNVIAHIEPIFKLYEASILSKSAFLRFRGYVDDDTTAELEIYIDHSKRSTRYIFTATVGEYKYSFDDSYHVYSSIVDHMMNWVKTVIPYKTGKELPEGTNAVLELWAETPEGEQFLKDMNELGFESNGRGKCMYWYSSPFETYNACDKIIPLEYSEDFDHFKEAWDYGGSYKLNIRVEMRGKEPVFFMTDDPIMKRMKEYGFKCDERFIKEFSDDKKNPVLLHEYGLPPKEFLETVKSLFKFNEDRIDKISEEHGGLTWRGIDFRTSSDKFEFPVYGFDSGHSKLPKQEVDRIKARIAKRRVERLAEVEEILLKSKFKNIIAYLKEHGELGLYPHQYGDEIRLEFRMPVKFDIPVKQGESFTKKKLDVTGNIWVSGEEKKAWTAWNAPDRYFHPDSMCFTLPFSYQTADGTFPSWDEAVAAGGDLQYGGQFCTGKRAGFELKNNEYHHDYEINEEGMARFEKLLLNIEADYERYLVDLHYKDAPNG